MNRKLLYIIIISFIIRAFFAAFLELGNDEVYYRIFGLYPDWSYFDHSPMVGWLVRLTTLGATDVSEFFVRLGSLIIGAINTYIIYSIAKKLASSENCGVIAALLYTGSIYCSVIFGLFIMPDTPLSLFWLLAIYYLIQLLPKKNYDHKKMLLAGLFIGLAIMSKYSAAYLWGATGLYIVIFNRKWLFQWSLYVAFVVTLICTLPIILWNYQYDFISFTFHSGRVVAENTFNWLYFGREILGNFFYNGPINFVIIIIAMFSLKRVAEIISWSKVYFLLVFSLPMIAMFLAVSTTRETLPHWSAPAYFSLIILASVALNGYKWGSKAALSSPLFLLLVLIVGFVQIKTGFINLGKDSGGRMGNADFTLDMYGWQQGGEKFAQIVENDTIMPSNSSLMSFTWDLAAHVDTYFGQPIAMKTKAYGDVASTHYWEWINLANGGFKEGECLYMVVSSRLPIDVEAEYGGDFQKIMPADTIEIYRCDRHVMSFYVYRMIGLKPTSHALLPLNDALKLK